jgi:hypothetical protein
MASSLTRRTGTGFAKSPAERAISGQGKEEEAEEEEAVGACDTQLVSREHAEGEDKG